MDRLFCFANGPFCFINVMFTISVHEKRLFIQHKHFEERRENAFVAIQEVLGLIKIDISFQRDTLRRFLYAWTRASLRIPWRRVIKVLAPSHRRTRKTH
jgi:hypothetical protein